MAKNTPVPDTSAADTSIGFDYQFYYFFYLILDLRLGETIGFEIKDDVHVEFSNGQMVLIQTKHTVQRNAYGQIINLTERDIDLWKTLSNWSGIVTAKTDKKEYLRKTKFQLITNKNNEGNNVLINLYKVQRDQMSIEDFQYFLKNLIQNTSDVKIKTYMKAFAKIPKTILHLFIQRIQFGINEDNLIERIKNRILEKIHIEEKVNDVYSELHSALRDHNYLTVKSGDTLSISFSDFNRKFKNCFKPGLSTKLPIREVAFTIPDDPSKQLFIQQLIDIGDLNASEKERMIELTTHLLKLFNNLKEWEETDGLLPRTKLKFNKDTMIIWTNSFRSIYREITEKLGAGTTLGDLEADIKAKALECLDEMRRQSLKIDDTELDIELSNGQFYLLTEERSIGWHFDWKKKYE